MNTPRQSPNSWLAVAAPVIGRALVVSVVLGAILTGVNQPAAVFGNADFQPLPLVLVFLTPFVVVAFSQVLGMRAARRAATQMPRGKETLFETTFSHGIPMRAIIVGSGAALVNSAIMTADLIISGQSFRQFPIPLMLQAMTLPIIFGALSQAVSFRRTLVATSSIKSILRE